MKYVIQYTLPYEHRVMVGIKAEVWMRYSENPTRCTTQRPALCGVSFVRSFLARLSRSCPPSPQVLPATVTRASNSRAKGGAASSGACGPRWSGIFARMSRHQTTTASLVTGECLAHVLPEPKAPSSLVSEAG